MNTMFSKLIAALMISSLMISTTSAVGGHIVVTKSTITVNDTLIVPPEDPATRFWFEFFKVTGVIGGPVYVEVDCNSDSGTCGWTVRAVMKDLSSL